MGLIEQYARNKDKLDEDIADEVKRLYLEGLTYQEALKKAKEMYIGVRMKKAIGTQQRR